MAKNILPMKTNEDYLTCMKLVRLDRLLREYERALALTLTRIIKSNADVTEFTKKEII